MSSVGSEPGQSEAASYDDLRASVDRVSEDVQALAGRVLELKSALQSLEPQPAAGAPGRSGSEAGRQEMVVSVSPLPELAMAAVAETALRGLKTVQKVISVERSNDQATFVLEIEEGGDLAAEMGRAMPVPLIVDTASDGSLKVVLEWALGRSTASAG